MKGNSAQLGFGFDAMAEEEEAAHLPSGMDEGIAAYRAMLEKNDAAMCAGHEEAAMAIRKEANRLAVKLNGGELGVLGGPDAPGYVLMDQTAAAPGTVPVWGQKGEFDSNVGDLPVHISMDGMLGICASMNVWPHFSANMVEADKPFFSETGYRSFMGGQGNLVSGLTPDVFAREVIEAHIMGDCKGRLRLVKPEYRERY